MNTERYSVRISHVFAYFVAGVGSILGASSGYAFLRSKPSSAFPLYRYSIQNDIYKAARNYKELAMMRENER